MLDLILTTLSEGPTKYFSLFLTWVPAIWVFLGFGVIAYRIALHFFGGIVVISVSGWPVSDGSWPGIFASISTICKSLSKGDINHHLPEWC